MKRLLVIGLAIGCGGGKGGDPQDVAACTADEQEVEGDSLTFEVNDLGFDGGSPAATRLITTEAQLAAELGGTIPSFLSDVDFATDRVVLGASNPAVRFIVQPAPGQLFAGEEPLCQGIAPSRVGYVLRGDTSDDLTVISCPYSGPDPCLAP